MKLVFTNTNTGSWHINAGYNSLGASAHGCGSDRGGPIVGKLFLLHHILFLFSHLMPSLSCEWNQIRVCQPLSSLMGGRSVRCPDSQPEGWGGGPALSGRRWTCEPPTSPFILCLNHSSRTWGCVLPSQWFSVWQIHTWLQTGCCGLLRTLLSSQTSFVCLQAQ